MKDNVKFVVREMYQCDYECDHTDLSKEKLLVLSKSEALDRINDPLIHADGFTPYNEDDTVEEITDCLWNYCDLEVVRIIPADDEFTRRSQAGMKQFDKQRKNLIG